MNKLSFVCLSKCLHLNQFLKIIQKYSMTFHCFKILKTVLNFENHLSHCRNHSMKLLKEGSKSLAAWPLVPLASEGARPVPNINKNNNE